MAVCLIIYSFKALQSSPLRNKKNYLIKVYVFMHLSFSNLITLIFHLTLYSFRYQCTLDKKTLLILIYLLLNLQRLYKIPFLMLDWSYKEFIRKINLIRNSQRDYTSSFFTPFIFFTLNLVSIFFVTDSKCVIISKIK